VLGLLGPLVVCTSRVHLLGFNKFYNTRSTALPCIAARSLMPSSMLARCRLDTGSMQARCLEAGAQTPGWTAVAREGRRCPRECHTQPVREDLVENGCAADEQHQIKCCQVCADARSAVTFADCCPLHIAEPSPTHLPAPHAPYALSARVLSPWLQATWRSSCRCCCPLPRSATMALRPLPLAAGARLSPATSPITFPRSLEPLC
jgi:hypothetical protein